MSETRDLMTRLKEDTRQQHEEAEAAGYMHQLMAGRLSRDRFLASIEQTYLLHVGLTPMLKDLRQSSPKAAGVLKDYHLGHAEAAKRDLEFFGISTQGLEPNDGVRQFLADAQAVSAKHPEVLLGMFYVLEGSLNGAKILMKKYAELFQLDGVNGTQHLDPHGKEMRQRWMEFVMGMNNTPFDEPVQQAMVDAASLAFRDVGMMYKDICLQVA